MEGWASVDIFLFLFFDILSFFDDLIFRRGSEGAEERTNGMQECLSLELAAHCLSRFATEERRRSRGCLRFLLQFDHSGLLVGSRR